MRMWRHDGDVVTPMVACCVRCIAKSHTKYSLVVRQIVRFLILLLTYVRLGKVLQILATACSFRIAAFSSRHGRVAFQSSARHVMVKALSISISLSCSYRPLS